MSQKQEEIGTKRLLQLSGEIIKIKIIELQEVPESISASLCPLVKSSKGLFIYQIGLQN